MQAPKFSIHSKVRLRDDPTKRGRIIEEPRALDSSFEYLVGFGGDEEGWYQEDDIEPTLGGMLPRWEKRDHFLCDLLLAKLKNPLSDSLYAVSASRTIFEAYQFRPVLKFLNNPDQRILIADEVGLGKTIEAAIIYLELKARLNINRVLVLCPSRLKLKWKSELSNRFSEDFMDMSSAYIRTLLDDYRRVGNGLSFRGIASYESLRRDEFIDAFAQEQLPIDLLIVDEAHYLRNPNTRTNQIGQILAENADAVVFLTATPLQLGNENLYSLLSILAPGDFNDPSLFEYQIEPNKHVNMASRQLAAGDLSAARQELMAIESTLYGSSYRSNPMYLRSLDQLSRTSLELEERIAIQKDLLELNTISRLFSRTRKREVSHAAKRAAFTLRVQLTEAEHDFYHAIVALVRRQLEASVGATGFGMVTKERMAASCLTAVRMEFERTSREKRLAQVDSEAIESELAEDEDTAFANRQEIDELLALSSIIGTADSKFDTFIGTLQQALNDSPDSKVLVFSTFRGTLKYLYERLSNLRLRVGVIHGDVKIPERQRIIDEFKADPEFRILLSSEVGAEGLDFQFCDILFNYDLPWNPMQIEQRIGRLDRFGQTAERIRIYNLYLEDTIETRIYQRLYNRIGIFEQSIGDLEDILGEEIRNLTQEVIQKNLTPEEQVEVAEQAAERIIKRRNAIEEVDARKDELLGQDAILGQLVETTISSGRIIHAEEVRALVKTFLTEQFPRVDFLRDSEEPTWELKISPELSAHLFEFRQRNRTTAFQASERWNSAMGSNRSIALTFQNEIAMQRPLLELVTTQHLLAGAAREYWQSRELTNIPSCYVTLYGPTHERGLAHFFIFALDQQGMEKRRTLQPVVICDDGRHATETSQTLMAQIQHPLSSNRDLEEDSVQYVTALGHAMDNIARLRNAQQNEMNERQVSRIQARIDAVSASFDAKIKKAQETKEKIWYRDPRLFRLYDGRIANLQAQKVARITQLESNVGISIGYTLIAAGRALIGGEIPTD